MLHGRLAREAGRAVDVHRARAADRRAARAAEADRAVDFSAFDVLERVEHGHAISEGRLDLVAVRNLVGRLDRSGRCRV